MATIDDLISVLQDVKGTTYKWYNGFDGEWYGPPMYMGSGWSATDVYNAGINCSGLFNWGLQQVGLSPVGGTPAYWDIATAGQIDPNWEATYSPGQFVITMSGGQGHMAMVSGPDNLLIQADTYYNYANENHYLWIQQPFVYYEYVGWIPGLDW